MTDSTIHALTALELRRAIARGELTSSEATAHFLDRIERLDHGLRAFVTVTADAARERAAELDAARRAGATEAEHVGLHPLWGMPFADKDLVDRAGVPTSYGSVAFAGYVPTEDAPLAATMTRAGGVSLGKTITPEFGLTSYTRNRIGEPARNPWDRSTDPGGSSGGAAVAVAARLLPFAPGSDGGGSIRIPSASCGLVGLKPSRGRVPDASGLDSLAGLPVGGPLARTTLDAALLLDGMIARDRGGIRYRSEAVAPGGEASYVHAVETRPLGPLRVGFNAWSPWASGGYRVEPDAEHLAALESVCDRLRALGHAVEPVRPADFPAYSEAFRTVWQTGAAAAPLSEEALAAVEPLTRWLVGVGRTRTAADLAAALAALARFEQHVIATYRDYDVVLTPALAMPARPLDWYDLEDGERNFAQQCEFTPFTSYLNVAGLPAISMPVAHGALPVGVQAIGRPGDELTLLQLSLVLEREYGWAERMPAAAVL